MDRFPELSEGGLSKLRASLVNESGLRRIANSLELGQFLLMGKGEEMTGGREKASLLADAVEALFAAIYLDSREQQGTARGDANRPQTLQQCAAGSGRRCRCEGF
jgi:ribonuclease-3